jgi:hypothetical protein
MLGLQIFRTSDKHNEKREIQSFQMHQYELDAPTSYPKAQTNGEEQQYILTPLSPICNIKPKRCG